MPVERPFGGDFLFVNHNAEQMKALPNRRKVFSHVQNQYRSWKRQEEIRALRASIKAPLPDAQPSVIPKGSAPVLNDTWPSSNVKHARRVQGPGTAGSDAASRQRASTKIAIRSLIHNKEDPERPDHIAPFQPQSVMTILGKGNSDPFGAYAVEITPATNDMLSFHRDFVIPALYHTTKHRWMTSASAWRDWRDCIDGLGDGVDGLGDEGAGSGFIASCAAEAAVISLNPSVQKQAVYYRAKSMAVLRKRLTAGSKFHRGQLYWHIHLLVAADVLMGELIGTAAHLNMLRCYFDHDDENKLGTDLLLYVIYYDIHRSSMFLCKPIFDVDKWLPERLQPVVDAAKPYLPDLSEVRDRFLDPSIDDARLRTLFIERRESLAVWLFHQKGSSEEESGGHTTALMGWLLVRVYLHQGRLVNLFLQANAQYYETISSPSSRLMNSILCQGYLSLATLLYIRAISFNAAVCGVRLFDATATILSNMQKMLQLSERPDSPNYERYEHARLWALYVGASAEWFMDMKPEELERGWFTTHFAAKAIKLGVVGWDEVRSVLRGFLFTDIMHPDGEEWFARVLSTARKKAELDKQPKTDAKV
ncbi:uncharacterized protein Z520_11540 [Fonsecaea multimorphosa CBS 102226]|uniref:Transcription factor domain-containing protein n=1 Tax=Fonsecaea multimorphosa CBS 102226 TaxID=1442371 RepID=A0A0D2K8L1_9EURO|nr:uncharacterized protein Z520_11540 [Fonsecaea multimorphosa CBS 102226]KIX92688.1 hypothetical protein Z520_11540 [Fonsecaea multimorphosa CBS 102226]OAL17931.1 hypothetical protein AYO22_11087 [Fonsecaea multimorphosa]